MNGDVEFTRHSAVFDPSAFREEVHIIGVGATGSSIGSECGRLGVPRMHVWDPDHVEPHNPPNSLIFTREHIGKPKVEVVAEYLHSGFGTVVMPHHEAFDGTKKIRGIVFLCVDDMDVMQQIWRTSIKYQPFVKMMVETRVNLDIGLVHTVFPMRKRDVDGFEGTFYSSKEAEQPACTAKIIVTTTSIIAGIATDKLIQYVSQDEAIPPVVKVEKGEGHSAADMFCLRPIVTTATDWDGEEL